MKWISVLAATLLVAVIASPIMGQDQDTRPGIAVMALQNGGSYGPDAEDLAAMRVGLQQMLLVEFQQNSALRIVERSQLRQILDELNLLKDSLVSSQTAARIGQLVGARYLVMGSFMDLYGDFHLNARVVDTETGEILVTERVSDERGKIYPLIVSLANQLTEAIDLPALPVEIREQRQSRDIPNDAVYLMSRAVTYEDGGETERAIDTYRRVIREFPQVTQARIALEQYTTAERRED
ncbi:MAG: hypothetical protein OER90_12775 [Gemmatimonadota bacterium]|nr:hypothetical protein [Gemmatimonadota bacterium]